jgi:hypothetical protein
MLQAAFLGCALVLPALLTTGAQGQLDFGFGGLLTEHTERVQTPLTRDYRLTCEAIEVSISPASDVFYPGVSLLPPAVLLSNP